MAWLKRNLMLVVGGGVALVLLAVAILYLLDRIKQNAAATEELNTKVAEFKALLDRPVHPGGGKVNNIAAAKEEAKTLSAFRAEERKLFGAPLSTNKLNNKEFRALLDTTVDQLQREAERAGVILPTKDYWFTFAAQKASVEFAPNTLGPLSAELNDIKAICELLYKARVQAITGLKRVPVAKEDSGPVDYTVYKAVTNELAVVVPYEVSFQGFSAELEHVLESFAKAPQFFAVKNLAEEKVQSMAGLGIGSPEVAQPVFRPGGQPGEGRYSPPPRPGFVPGAPRPGVGRGGLVTVLDESKLRFQLRVDVIKLKPQPAQGK
jgi:hypothetical protein